MVSFPFPQLSFRNLVLCLQLICIVYKCSWYFCKIYWKWPPVAYIYNSESKTTLLILTWFPYKNWTLFSFKSNTMIWMFNWCAIHLIRIFGAKFALWRELLTPHFQVLWTKSTSTQNLFPQKEYIAWSSIFSKSFRSLTIVIWFLFLSSPLQCLNASLFITPSAIAKVETIKQLPNIP